MILQANIVDIKKLVEGCLISDLALVSSPEVACGFKYDSNHRVPLFARNFFCLLPDIYTFHATAECNNKGKSKKSPSIHCTPPTHTEL